MDFEQIIILIWIPIIWSIVEIVIQLWVKLVNKKFQWLIISKDERPKLSKTGLSGIFAASLEALHSRRSTFLFATHFHEIQKYDEINKLDISRFFLINNIGYIFSQSRFNLLCLYQLYI